VSEHEQLDVCKVQFAKIVEVSEDIKDIKKMLLGNGRVGLFEKANRLDDKINEMREWRANHDDEIKTFFEKKSKSPIDMLFESKLLGVPSFLWVLLALIHGPEAVMGAIKMLSGAQ